MVVVDVGKLVVEKRESGNGNYLVDSEEFVLHEKIYRNVYVSYHRKESYHTTKGKTGKEF